MSDTPGQEEDYEKKLAEAQRLLAEAGIARGRYAPLAFLLLRRLGMRLRPPQFTPFPLNMLIYGGTFGLLYFLGMYLAARIAPASVQSVGVAGTVVAGAVYGGLMAMGYAYTARLRKLPSWAELH